MAKTKNSNARWLLLLTVAAFALFSQASATPVTDCINITSADTYELQNDITNSDAIACINITVSNVIFDGKGYTIDGTDTDSTYGVSANSGSSLTNITVENVKLTDWYRGIYYYYASQGSINNVTIASNTQHGIYLQTSNNNTLTNNNASSNSNYGLGLYSSTYNILTNNNAGGNGIGIALSAANSNTLTSNIANSNGQYGIYFSSANNNNLTNNTANNNAEYGLHLQSATTNTLTNNVANSNGIHGIYFYSADTYNSLINNTANNNTYYGIYLTNSLVYYNSLINNTANSNKAYGIYLRAGNNTLTGNTANNNIYGIFLYGASNNNLTSNTANSNARGFFLYMCSNSNLLTSNTASQNSNSGFYLHSCSTYDVLTDNYASDNKWDVEVQATEYPTMPNTFSNQTIGNLYPTKISFAGYGNIYIKGVTNPPARPSGYARIDELVNATSSSWLYLNISYPDDLPLNESTLFLARNNGSWETTQANFASAYGINTDGNYVYANITSFGSVFAPLASKTTLADLIQQNAGQKIEVVLAGSGASFVASKTFTPKLISSCGFDLPSASLGASSWSDSYKCIERTLKNTGTLYDDFSLASVSATNITLDNFYKYEGSCKNQSDTISSVGVATGQTESFWIRYGCTGTGSYSASYKACSGNCGDCKTATISGQITSCG